MAAALADALGFDPSFFYGLQLDEFRDNECAFRRRLTTQISARAKALAYGTLLGQLIHYLCKLVRFPTANLPNIPAGSASEIEVIANKCRIQWQLKLDLPIGDMVRVAESAGVPVAKFRGLGEKIDSFSRHGDRSVIVLTDKPPSRCRWDVAHELGHLVLHQNVPTGSKETEAQADKFAASLLMPRRFLHEFPRNLHGIWDRLFQLKKTWMVSLAAMIRKAYEHGLINPAQYLRLYKELSARGWLKSEPFEFPQEKPQVISLAFDVLSRAHQIDHRAAQEVLGWAPATFEKITGFETVAAAPAVAKVLPLVRPTRLRRALE